MSSKRSASSEAKYFQTPDWVGEILGIDLPDEGACVDVKKQPFVMQRGILRAQQLVSSTQAQTSEAFGFKWQKRDTFESPASMSRARAWLAERWGELSVASWWKDYGSRPLVVDAGCGAAMSTLESLNGVLSQVRYLGIDISEAVEIAAQRFTERDFEGGFLQADITNLPLSAESVDVIYSDGVLHHTDSTEDTMKSLAAHLRPGGRFLFYVYRRKGPIREFVDDDIRAKLQDMEPSEAWEAMMPLTKLGKLLGELELEIEIPEAIDLLKIPAGRIDLQRFIYWYVFKAFYSPDFTLDEMNHINFDWYAPANAHRQSPEEVRTWCEEANLVIEREVIEEAGITIIARKRK